MNKPLMMLAIWVSTLSSVPLTAQEPHVHETLSVREHAAGQRINDYLTQAVPQGFSGTVLVARNGKRILSKGYGLANRESKLAFSNATVVSVGSVTKQFTGTAILKLAERGKLKVADPLSVFFEKLPEDKRGITVHQLLTHSAGLVDVVGGDFEKRPKAEFFQTLFDTKLLFEPGTKHAYSNAGYSVLAAIVEKVSGQDYETFLQNNLFAPLGMKQTGYLQPAWDENLLAAGYRRGVVSEGNLIERFQADDRVSWNLKGNGGIHSTVDDMYKWYQALKTNKVLSEDSMKKLTTRHISEQEDGSSHYGYGWAIFTSKRNTKIVSHNGSNGVFFHDFLWIPEEDVVIIFFTNAYSENIENLAWKMERFLFDDAYQPNPIKKNPYLFVFDFIENNEPAKSRILLKSIQRDYTREFDHEAPLNRMGYLLMESPKTKSWAVELFKINAELHPNDGNVWDSLADGYLALEMKEEAIRALQEAVKLNARGSSEKLEKLTDDK